MPTYYSFEILTSENRPWSVFKSIMNFGVDSVSREKELMTNFNQAFVVKSLHLQSLSVCQTFERQFNRNFL